MSKKRQATRSSPKSASTTSAKSRTVSSQKRKSTQRQPLPWLWIVLGAVLVVGTLAAAYFMLQPKAATPLEISTAEAYAKYQGGAFVLDVREQEEWDQGHIPNTTLIPLGSLASRLDEVPRDQEVVVVCRSGNRSQEGTQILRQAGFEQVSSMSGGVRDWAAAGYPFEGTPP
jgi:rhodanese-related sulfurtransferase